MKRLISRLRFTLRRFFGKTSAEADLHDELQSYLQHDIDARLRAGGDPAEARRQAALEFGGVDQIKEIVRENRAGAWAGNLWQDLRYAVRTLLKAPTFSLSVIGSLSLGIAATITAFAFINALMFQPFPGIQRQEELTELRVTTGCGGKTPCWFPTGDYPALRDGMTRFISFTGFAAGEVAYEARLVQAVFVLPDYFETLGVQPAIGRGLTSDDTDAVVISNTMWQRDFSADPAVLGKLIRIGARRVRIVGVAPQGFQGLQFAVVGPGASEFWLPIAKGADLQNWGSNEFFLRFIGRREPGTQDAAIRAQAEVVFSQIAANRGMVTTPGRVFAGEVAGFDSAKRPLAISLVMLVPILVLMLSCVNAANMLFGRAAVRDREIAIRLSMGASRWRVVGQLLIESVVLSIAAAIVSVPMATIALNLAAGQLFGLLIPIDIRVLAATLGTAFLCALAFGLTPALRMTALNPGRTLVGSGSPIQVQIRRNLVISQVALSFALVAVGTQLVASLLAMGGSAGVHADRLLLATFNLEQVKLPAEEADAFYQRLAERIGKLPQAEAAGVGPALWHFGGHVFETGEINRLTFWRPDAAPNASESVRGGTVDPGVFEAVGMPLAEGRWFNDEDRRQARPRVAIVNRAFAEKVMQGPAIGRVLRLAGQSERNPSPVEVAIVGVVDNFAEPRNERGQPGWFVYIPSPLEYEPARVLYVRARGHVDSLPAAVAKAVQEIDPRVPIGHLASLDQLNYQSMPEARLAQGAQAFGFVGLILATFGMYGVMSYSAAQRSREIAIRIALGAEERGILRMVLKQAMTLASIGVTIGSILAVIASLGLQILNRAPLGIHGVSFAGSGLLLLSAMLLASAIPAIRASRVNPIDNLKQS